MARWTTGTWAVCALAGGKKKPASVRAEGNQGQNLVGAPGGTPTNPRPGESSVAALRVAHE